MNIIKVEVIATHPHFEEIFQVGDKLDLLTITQEQDVFKHYTSRWDVEKQKVVDCDIKILIEPKGNYIRTEFYGRNSKLYSWETISLWLGYGQSMKDFFRKIES